MKPPQTLAGQVLVDILAKEMNLTVGQVFLQDQNFPLKTDQKFYISLGLGIAYPISNVCDTVEQTAGTPPITTLMQRSKVVQREDIHIDLFSAGTDALFRHWEVLAALRSIYSQQQQELKNFKIFQIPRSFVNTSSAEGGSFINRYTIVISCHVWYEKLKPLTNAGGGDYFDDFTTRVDDEQTIGTETPLIEFEINEEGIVQ